MNKIYFYNDAGDKINEGTFDKPFWPTKVVYGDIIRYFDEDSEMVVVVDSKSFRSIRVEQLKDEYLEYLKLNDSDDGVGGRILRYDDIRKTEVVVLYGGEEYKFFDVVKSCFTREFMFFISDFGRFVVHHIIRR